MGTTPGNLDVLKGSGIGYVLLNNKIMFLTTAVVLVGGIVLFAVLKNWWSGESELGNDLVADNNSTASYSVIG